MDDRDRANLLFLIRTPPHVLSEWFPTLDRDDQAYAISLLYLGRLELLDAYLEDVPDYTEALEVISRISQK